MKPRLAWLLAALALTASACTATAGAASSSSDPDPAQPAVRDVARATIEPIDWEAVPEGAAYIARVKGLTSVLDAPGGTQVALLDPTTDFGSTTTLSVVGTPGPHDEWIEVMLNQRPNGTAGWVWADDVDLMWTTLHIEIDLEQRELRLYDGEELLIRGETAVGSQANPTPTGRTFVTDRVASTGPDALYGPFALGLALYSEVLTEYAGGDGQVAIHGTNTPRSLGQAVSHGCARVHNDVIMFLAGKVPLGTPVTIY